jgi:hypothetical protein
MSSQSAGRTLVLASLAIGLSFFYAEGLQTFLFVINFLLGFAIFHFGQVYRKQLVEINPYLDSIRWKVGNNYVHLHHWFWLSAVLATALATGFPPKPWDAAVHGFAAGGIVHGASYDNWFKLFYRNKDGD